MIICFRRLRHWDVNNLFNDATAWMDDEMSCDLTRDLMWIVSACHECKKNCAQHKETNKCTQVHKMRNKCVGTAFTSTSTLWFNRPDSHKPKPETCCFLQVKVPSTAPHNEARRSWTCRHSSGERSRAIQMLTRSELCVHRNATLYNRIPLSCSGCDLNS